MCIAVQAWSLAIRRFDTNHLILGSFIKEWALSVDSWKKAAPYVDMIAPQHVNEFISVNEIGKATNLPIIFSDEYFGFHYPAEKAVCTRDWSHTMHGAEVYEANLMRHFKDPQVMGVTYCACMYDQGGNTLAKNNQNGFYSLSGEPREKLIDAVTHLNHSVYEHAADPASPRRAASTSRIVIRQMERAQCQKRTEVDAARFLTATSGNPVADFRVSCGPSGTGHSRFGHRAGPAADAVTAYKGCV